MTIMPNGIRLIVKRNRSNRILAISCYFSTGAFFEPAQASGITNFVCRTMLKGTKKRSAFEIAEAMEEVGGEIDAAAGEDFSEVSTISTVDDIDRALDVLSDVIVNPIFPEDEVGKERENIIASIRRQEDSSFQYTYKNFRALLYENHPYARPTSGTVETIQAIRQPDLAQYHRENFTARGLLMIVVGDVDPDAVARKITRYFAELPAGAAERVVATLKFRSRARGRTLTKEVEQAFIIVGYPTERATAADYVALKVAAAVLGSGGSMSSRLFTRLRDQQGLAYAVGCSMPTLRDKSHFFAYIGTRRESIDAARNGLLSVIQSLTAEPLPAEELERAKKHMIGQFRIGHQRNSAQADYLALYEMVGLGARFDEAYPELVKRVTAEQVKAVAAKYFRAPTVTVLQPTGKRATRRETASAKR